MIGVSGGLDSTHALIVAARTMDLLGLPRTRIKAYTMPAFGTSGKTYRNALRLMKALGVEANEVDIKPACLQMLKDIDHPFARGKKCTTSPLKTSRPDSARRIFSDWPT